MPYLLHKKGKHLEESVRNRLDYWKRVKRTMEMHETKQKSILFTFFGSFDGYFIFVTFCWIWPAAPRRCRGGSRGGSRGGACASALST